MLEAPTDIREDFANDDFAAGYINFYVCNGAVIAPELATSVPMRRLKKRCNARSLIAKWCKSTLMASRPVAVVFTAPPSKSLRLERREAGLRLCFRFNAGLKQQKAV